MKIKIRTLTPIHIGTGKELTSLDYYDNVRIDSDKLFDLLAEEKQEEFFRWLDTNQKLMFSPNDISRKFGIRTSVLVDKCALYKFKQHFREKVREGIKDSYNNLLVPGSSIKGSIRTALVYKVLKKPIHRSFLLEHLNTLINRAKRILNQGHNITNLLKSADDELVIKVFNCGVISEPNRNNPV